MLSAKKIIEILNLKFTILTTIRKCFWEYVNEKMQFILEAF